MEEELFADKVLLYRLDSQAKEWKEMRIVEKGFKEKKEIIQQARMDYRMGRKGKAFEELNI